MRIFSLCPHSGQRTPDASSDLGHFSATRPMLGGGGLPDGLGKHGLVFPGTEKCLQPRPGEHLLQMALTMLLKSAATEFSLNFKTSSFPLLLRATSNVFPALPHSPSPHRANLTFAQQTQRRLPDLSPRPTRALRLLTSCHGAQA